MNDRRYKSYLFISRVFASDLFNAFEREVLLDAAEGLLLTRSLDSPEMEQLERNVDAALEGLVAGRRIHATTAAELKERVEECGPVRTAAVAA